MAAWCRRSRWPACCCRCFQQRQAGRRTRQWLTAIKTADGDEQHLAGQRDLIHQSAQPGQPGFPADDAGGLLRAEFTGAWHATDPLGECVQRRPRAQQRLWTGHARGAQSAVTPRIPLVPAWSHSDDWAGVTTASTER